PGRRPPTQRGPRPPPARRSQASTTVWRSPAQSCASRKAERAPRSSDRLDLDADIETRPFRVGGQDGDAEPRPEGKAAAVGERETLLFRRGIEGGGEDRVL